MKYKGKVLKGPFPAMGIKRLKGGKCAAFVVMPNGVMMRGLARDTWEECQRDIEMATFLSVPARVYV